MRQINLQEYQRSGPHKLPADERDALRRLASLFVEPAEGLEGEYTLMPQSVIGAVEVGGLSVLIKPKIGISQVMSLACYAIGNGTVEFQREDFDFREENALPDALAMALTFQARKAFARGLLHGYRTEEEALYTVRGRIRFDDQLRRRFGVPLPVEVRYDEFTADVLANQLVKAAAYRLGRARLRSTQARRNLGWLASMLEEVSQVEFRSTAVPSVQFDRLNEHYRGVVELSRLILRHGAFESGRGAVRASGFLMDMNVVFQEFVAQALRDKLKELRVPGTLFGEKYIGSLDQGNAIRLRPDLTLWQGKSCVFVGDAKYKRIAGDRIPNADLYQLLAYTTAENLPGGLLIYAEDETVPGSRDYSVRHANKRLEVAALDLTGTLEETLERVKSLAQKVVALRRGVVGAG